MNALLEQNERKRNVIRTLALFLCCMMFLSVIAFGTADVAYCEPDDTKPVEDPGAQIEYAVNEMTTKIYVTMRRIITPITICFLALSGFQFLFGGRQGTEKARTMFIASFAGIALVVFAPLFANAIASWFASSGAKDLSEYNPLI